MLAAVASSARGGLSSAEITDGCDNRHVEKAGHQLYYHNGVFGALASLPSVPFAPEPTAVEEMPRLRAALGGGPRLLVKRDDAIGFAFGGNKVRKMRLLAADALSRQADTLITCGGVQSNHARVTAAAAAKLGLRCVLVANGTPPQPSDRECAAGEVARRRHPVCRRP